ncbi:MAG: hypothetical protein HYV04_04550 [Deltaproteobacteria bacterium]|nr:hypothetical protein [Deltaproteobacteria bacterium]
MKKVEFEYYGRPLSIEVGKLAKQADGSALVRYGETVVLVTAVAAKELRLDTDFFPLTVDYQEPPERFPAAFSSGRDGRRKRKFSPRVWLTARSGRFLLMGCDAKRRSSPRFCRRTRKTIPTWWRCSGPRWLWRCRIFLSVDLSPASASEGSKDSG